MSVPHDVSVLTPHSFRLRPVGVLTDEPGYSIVVQRSAFRMRAQVVLDALGGRIRTAILSGMATNPAAKDRTSAAIREAGWRPEIRISDYDLYIGAVDQATAIAEYDALLASCVNVAGALSEFVLAQLVVTRKLETRPAASREVSEPAEENPVWEYDPSERDRATLKHRLIENWLIDRVREEGLSPLDAVRGPQFDLAWTIGETLVICEVKTTGGDEVKQLRLGLGQAAPLPGTGRERHTREHSSCFARRVATAGWNLAGTLRRTGNRVVLAGRRPAPDLSDSTVMVLRVQKTLSPNDIGDTGSHQAGISCSEGAPELLPPP